MQKQQETSSLVVRTLQPQPLSAIYLVQDVQKFISRQLEEIIPHLYEVKWGGVHVSINLPLKQEQYAFNLGSGNVISFSIVLGVGYPLHPPKIYLKSPITQPNINDCRDLLSQVIQEWNIKISLNDIIQKLPLFLQKLQKMTDGIKLQWIGRFEVGSVYHLRLLKQLNGQEFLAFELTEQTIKLYVISQTETHFLLMLPSIQPQFVNQKLVVPKQQQIGKMTLVFMAQIQCLSQVKINKDQHLEYIFTFSSIKTRNLQLESVNITKKLKIANGFQLIGKILRCIRKYQSLEISLDTHPIKNSEQMLILNEIDKKEQKLKHYLNHETIEEMNEAYQSAVEYYSGQGLPYYQIYLSKISQMYTRSDIKLILKAQ